MITKVIFFLEQPFSQRNYDRLGIEILQKNKFEVSVFDFTSVLHPRVGEEVVAPDPIDFSGLKSFKTEKEAFAAISQINNEDTFVVWDIGVTPKQYPIFRALSQKNLKYALPVYNKESTYSSEFTTKNKEHGLSKKKITDFTLRRIYFALINRSINYLWKRRFGKMKPATFLLTMGKDADKNHRNARFSDEATQKICLHVPDYDLYLKIKNQPGIVNNIAIFLDEYEPFHPDYLYINEKPPATAESYYPKLVEFFDCLEEELSLKVKIAAHPRSAYEKHPDYWDKRSVVRGKTIALVQQAKLVIAHASNALRFAILFRKPIVFVTTNQLQNSHMKALIESKAALLGKKIINLDEPEKIDWDTELQVDEERYRNYENYLIKAEGSEKRFFWEIVADRLQQL